MAQMSLRSAVAPAAPLAPESVAGAAPAHAPAAVAAPAMALRTRLILTGPVAPTLLKLAAPNIVVMLVQAVMSAVDAFYLGWLGADALAGVALVYPLIMLMMTMSAGGLGGGISSS